MQYDPIKRALGNVFNKTPFLRVLFYNMLDLLLLRTWHIHKAIKSWSKTAPANASILDAGSGFGQYSYYLSSINRRWSILAVDVKDEQVADCNRFFSKINRNNVIFKVADLTKYVDPAAYDLILSVDVMEHILEDELVFRNFQQSLKPGGMLLIATPSDQGGSDVHEETGESFIDEHVRDGYPMQEMQEKLARAGFSKIEINYSYGKPGQLSWRMSMKYPLQLLNTSKIFFLIIPFYYLLVFPLCLLLNYLDTNQRHATGTGLIVKAWK